MDILLQSTSIIISKCGEDVKRLGSGGIREGGERDFLTAGAGGEWARASGE